MSAALRLDDTSGLSNLSHGEIMLFGDFQRPTAQGEEKETNEIVGNQK